MSPGMTRLERAAASGAKHLAAPQRCPPPSPPPTLGCQVAPQQRQILSPRTTHGADSDYVGLAPREHVSSYLLVKPKVWLRVGLKL